MAAKVNRPKAATTAKRPKAVTLTVGRGGWVPRQVAKIVLRDDGSLLVIVNKDSKYRNWVEADLVPRMQRAAAAKE